MLFLAQIKFAFSETPSCCLPINDGMRVYTGWRLAQRRMVRGLLPSCHGSIPKPIIGCLAPPPAKALLGHSCCAGQPLVALVHIATSLPKPVISPATPSNICAHSSVPIHRPNTFCSWIQAKFSQQPQIFNYQEKSHLCALQLLFHPHCFMLWASADSQLYHS